jgi:hypothetical protein
MDADRSRESQGAVARPRLAFIGPVAARLFFLQGWLSRK